MDLTRTEEMLALLNRRADLPHSTHTDDGEQSRLIQSTERSPLNSEPSVTVHQISDTAPKRPLQAAFTLSKKADIDLRVVLGDPKGPAGVARQLRYVSLSAKLILCGTDTCDCSAF